ncbi:5'/3'-nucleotidase SurE [Candidatus Pyrohabitans sp.]
MKKILVVNDDGINSPGLRAAVEALSGLGEITAVAPATQKSGVGRSMSLFSPVSISIARIDNARAFAIDGTPVDAVIVGIYGVLGETPDLLVSGINIGENMSCEATTSGTVGAAMEGASQGVPSIAISLHARGRIKFEEIQPEVDFSWGKRVLRRCAGFVLERGLPGGVDLLNINVPERPKGGVRITRLARRMYTTRLQRRRDPRGRTYFWIDGDPIYDSEPGTDVHAVRVEGSISISPLSLDFTSRSGWKDLEDLAELLRKD